jgi:hypothetical protein
MATAAPFRMEKVAHETAGIKQFASPREQNGTAA